MLCLLGGLLSDEILRDATEFFPGGTDSAQRWLLHYQSRLKDIDHDEQWLTLYAVYSIFGRAHGRASPDWIAAFQKILASSGMADIPEIAGISTVNLEKMMPEIKDYQVYLYGCLESGSYHLYPDRIASLRDKAARKSASLEGNTNVDVFIEASTPLKKIVFFIEAKYLSDISYQITYCPARDQISRNIDCGIDYVLSHDLGYDSLYFLLLTPKMFRIDAFGGNRGTPISDLHPQRSRLYCYRMAEAIDPDQLRQFLPHRRSLSDNDWKVIASHVGWATYEDILDIAKESGTLGPENRDHIIGFFRQRNLTCQ
jgi:hypothetical protein